VGREDGVNKRSRFSISMLTSLILDTPSRVAVRGSDEGEPSFPQGYLESRMTNAILIDEVLCSDEMFSFNSGMGSEEYLR
jgi:hypothetical protein